MIATDTEKSAIGFELDEYIENVKNSDELDSHTKTILISRIIHSNAGFIIKNITNDAQNSDTM